MGKADLFPNWASISPVQQDAMLLAAQEKKASSSPPPPPPGKEAFNPGLQEIIFLPILI